MKSKSESKKVRQAVHDGGTRPQGGLFELKPDDTRFSVDETATMVDS